MTARQLIVASIVLGLTAGLVVWWLERFETDRLAGEIGEYLRKRDLFEQFLRERGDVQ